MSVYRVSGGSVNFWALLVFCCCAVARSGLLQT
ncbi:GlyGly-CTERM sorting domain-containing protein [Deinococcus roseus]